MGSVQQDKNCFLTLNVMAKQSERITFQVLNGCSSTEANVRKSATFLLSTIVSSVLAFPCSSVLISVSAIHFYRGKSRNKVCYTE